MQRNSIAGTLGLAASQDFQADLGGEAQFP